VGLTRPSVTLPRVVASLVSVPMAILVIRSRGHRGTRRVRGPYKSVGPASPARSDPASGPFQTRALAEEGRKSQSRTARSNTPVPATGGD
jgi:hypothetical protein